MKKIIEIERGQPVPKDAKWLKETTICRWVNTGFGSELQDFKADVFEIEIGEPKNEN